jgi:hypothetical protein
MKSSPMKKSPLRMCRMCPRAALVSLVLTWGGAAHATPEFPGVVEQALGLSAITVDPPQGCTLCHTTDSGGTALRPFGSLMQQYGTQPYQDDSLRGALAAVEEKEPQLVADIKASRDPNDDPGASSLPTPEYGCSASRRGSLPGPGWPLAFVALAVTALLRRLRNARRELPPRRP